ncbi:MAG: T9SS type A sorting domain-containing protein, partial [Bacteroidia bacterium]|nr:T9SS type A sorting domain-containing protein [Bacteroidia bacterium]
NNDAINENNIVIFPNPTKDFIHFRGPMIPNLQVRLIDLTGRILLSADYSTRVQEEVDLDLRDFPSGLYLINFTWGNQTKTQRLIKE